MKLWSKKKRIQLSHATGVFYFIQLFVVMIALVVPVNALCSESLIAQKTNPKRIVTLAPNLTEIVFALGLGDQIVGVSSFDKYPSSVSDLPKVGGYFNPDLETIIALEPDVIFMVTGRSTQSNQLKITKADIHDFRCESYSDIQSTIKKIGNILNQSDAATRLCSKLESEMNSLSQVVGRELSVMICVGMTPGSLQNCYVAGQYSMHHDILTAIGCINCFGTTEKAYFPINKEALIVSRPDVILDLIPGQELTEEIRKQRLKTWEMLPGVPAVKTGNVIILNDECLNIPGPRITHAARLICNVIVHSISRNEMQ